MEETFFHLEAKYCGGLFILFCLEEKRQILIGNETE